MGAAESKGGESFEDVQEQLNAIRAKEAVLLKKMQASKITPNHPCSLHQEPETYSTVLVFASIMVRATIIIHKCCVVQHFSLSC